MCEIKKKGRDALTSACEQVVNGPVWITIVIVLAQFTMSAQGVVFTVEAYATTQATALDKQGLIELALERMVIACALLALVALAIACRLPFHIVVQWQTLFTVCAGRVVRALALAVDHAICVGHVILHALDLNASACMTIAKTTAPNHHLVHGIVVLFLDFVAYVEQIVAERVQLGHIDSQIGDLE